MLSGPRCGWIYFSAVDRQIAKLPLSQNRHRKPVPSLLLPDLIPVGKTVFFELDVVEYDVQVTHGDAVEVP